jgi:hypothetical protein
MPTFFMKCSRPLVGPTTRTVEEHLLLNDQILRTRG